MIINYIKTPKMARNSEREWHPNFRKYTEELVKHPNYDGLFYERNKEGDIQWVVTGKSAKGQLRQAWWDEQCRKHGVPIQDGCYAVISRMLHPTKKKVCQCCGKEVSILYEYPNKTLLGKINKHFGIELEQTSLTIREIIAQYCRTDADFAFFANAFNIEQAADMQEGTFPCKTEQLTELIYNNFVDKCKPPLSPGAMSNCPDRFDGFHSDGLCCRERTDKGRLAENMKTYSQDRRAYEEWADGDYNLANRLMGEFHKDERLYTCPLCGESRRMTADHIGPISLGFCHSKNFAALCDSCNSAKNNRLSMNDVQTLIALEDSGEQVVSWHAKPIWDALKHEIHNDDEAKKASAVMLQCHQNVLKLFALIYKKTGTEYLSRFLHPEYSFVDYRFRNFNPLDLSTLEIISKPLTSANKNSNAERYIRIAFESLCEFDAKENRKTQFVIDKHSDETTKLVAMINDKKHAEADALLCMIIRNLSQEIKETMWT